MSEMASDEEENIIPFQLQFDKPIPFQIKIAEWNPEKDLLAMVTEDSKILLHRFNWQRLWTISPGKPVTSLCWRPDGKAIAVGLEDGTIALHDVEEDERKREEKDERKRKYNVKYNNDVTREEMEAYRMQRVHQDDPLKALSSSSGSSKRRRRCASKV